MSDGTKTETAKGDKKDYESNELKRVSIELFAASFAMAGGRINAEALSDASINAAQVFLARFGQFKAGKVVFDRLEDALADCHAPNLRQSHPVNLVSRKYGKLDRLAEIWSQLEKLPESANEFSEFPEWKRGEITTARTLIPATLEKAKEIQSRISERERAKASETVN